MDTDPLSFSVHCSTTSGAYKHAHDTGSSLFIILWCKMNWGKTVLLILALITLSGYLYFFEIRGTAERNLTEAKRKQDAWRKIQVFPYQPQDFKYIKLVQDNKTIIYQKEDGVWWMTAPLNIRGDEAATDDIVHSIISVVETDPIEDNPADMVQFGLDNPQIVISIQLEGTEEVITLLLGNNNPTAITLYAKMEKSPRVFLVGSLIKWEVSKEFYKLSNRTGPFFTDKQGA